MDMNDSLGLVFSGSDNGAAPAVAGPLAGVVVQLGGGLSVTAIDGKFHANIIPDERGRYSLGGDERYMHAAVCHWADCRETGFDIAVSPADFLQDTGGEAASWDIP